MKIASLVLATLALALVAGCGDDDDEPQTLTGATGATGEAGTLETKADFIAAADEICKEAGDEFNALVEEEYPEGPPEGQEAAAFGEEVVIPNLQSQHDQIEALGLPEGEEDAINEILDGLQDAINELAEDPGTFATNDAFDEVSGLARDYGLKECGS